MTHVQTQVLGELPNLRQAELDGNPFSTAPGYKHTVVNQLGGLTSLDGDMLMKKDRDDAAHYMAYQKRRGLADDQTQRARQCQTSARSSVDPHVAESCADAAMYAVDDGIGGEAGLSFWTHSEIAVPLDRPKSAAALRRPATSHYNTRHYHQRVEDGSTPKRNTQVLANTLAGNSMAFLEKHRGSKASQMADAFGGDFDETGQFGRGADDVGGRSALFKDDFLNNNPILMEYMAQAALEDIDAEDEGGVGVGSGVEEQEDEAEEVCAGDDEINFIDVQSDAQVKAAVQGGHRAGKARPAIDVTALPVEARGWEGKANLEEEEACLSRSETSRPASRARRCGSFAAELRQVASTMSAVEAFSVEEIAALLHEANQRPAEGGLSLGEQLAHSLRPLTSSGGTSRGGDQEGRQRNTLHAGNSSGATSCGVGGERAGEAAGKSGSVGLLSASGGNDGELVRRLLKTVERLQVCTRTHIHTHAHIRTHARTRTHTRTHTSACNHAIMQSCIR